MKKFAALMIGLVCALLVIAFKLVILLGGFAVSNFGFKWSQMISVFMVLPFIWYTIRYLRGQNGGYIGGKEALRSGLTMAVTAILIISAYHYVEFEWKWRDIAQEYYNGETYLNFLKSHKEVKPEQYSQIIHEQIENIRLLSPFKYVTYKLVPFMLFSVTTAFMCAVFMKKGPAPSFTNN